MTQQRELYKQMYQAQINEWTAKLAVLKAQAEKATVQAKMDLQPRVESAHTHMEAARAKFEELSSASDDKWEEVKASADRAWEDVKAAVAGAYDAMKATPPPS